MWKEYQQNEKWPNLYKVYQSLSESAITVKAIWLVLKYSHHSFSYSDFQSCISSIDNRQRDAKQFNWPPWIWWILVSQWNFEFTFFPVVLKWLHKKDTQKQDERSLSKQAFDKTYHATMSISAWYSGFTRKVNWRMISSPYFQ